MSRSHGSLDVVNSPGGLVVSHQDDSIVAMANTPEPIPEWGPGPLSLPLPHRFATGERSKKKEVFWSVRNRWLSPPAWEVSALRA